MKNILKFQFSPWVVAIGFVFVWLCLRVFWLDGDPGIASIWEYGYNATDEGYYLDGGKEKFLWGTFVDLARTEAYTYGFSPGTHWLSYLAHLLFGLSTWAWRIPFVFVNAIAWFLMCRHLGAKGSPLEAFLLCAGLSCVPMIVSYERTASNDVLIGSILMLAYVLAADGGRLRLLLSACVAALMVLVKPSVFVLLPFVLSAVLQKSRFSRWWIDALVFLGTALAAVFMLKLIVAATLLPESAKEGLSTFELIRKTTTHYPLPSIFAFDSHFRGLSSFPRDPSGGLLGFLPALLVPVPLLFALRELMTARQVSRIVLFLSFPLYVAAVSVMNTIYTHYFIPAMVMLPAGLMAMRESLADGETPVGKWAVLRLRYFVLFGALAAGAAFLLFSDYHLAPTVAQNVYSRIYNLPSQMVWGAVGVELLGLTLGVTLLGAAFAPNRRLTVAGLLVLPAFVYASVVCAYLPGCAVASALKVDRLTFVLPMFLTLAVGSLVLLLTVVLPHVLARKTVLAAAFAATVCLGGLVLPTWRQAWGELMQPVTRYHQSVAQELAKILPADAIVIGERSNQLLMSLPIRTATTFAANSNPIPVLKSIRARYPEAPLYALCDSQHAYLLQNFQKNADKYQLRLVKKFSLPSFANGKAAEVYLCEVCQR